MANHIHSRRRRLIFWESFAFTLVCVPVDLSRFSLPPVGHFRNCAARRSTDTGDVLNDIDNMLQDLTDELDFMLETECDEAS